ncbi:MAG: HIT family protein [Candidatus Woesearchaeota archaeon]
MAELTEEQLKQMSPEQLRELQKKQCIFCQIISGKVSSKRMYEDERCLAILDINPANPGHVLILPKEHYSIMPLMPEDEINHLFRIARKVSKSQLRALKADGTNMFIANGAAAGQKAPHFMIHLIPRKENDGITAFNLPKNKITDEDQEKLRVAIKKKVDDHFGIEHEPVEPVEIVKPEPEQIDTTVDDEDGKESPEPPEGQEDSVEKNTEEEQQQEHQDPSPDSAGHNDQKDSENNTASEIAPPDDDREGKGADLDTIANMFK